MTKKNLKWRLSKLPTSEEVLNLVKDKVITNEEARDILFTEETEKEVSLEDAKKEIKFLKEIIEKLSDRNKIIETIRYIEKPYYYVQPWFQSYAVWCGSNISVGNSTCSTLTSTGSGGTLLGAINSNATNANFSAIN